MSVSDNLKELKEFIDENPLNLNDVELGRLQESYESMKIKYNV